MRLALNPLLVVSSLVLTLGGCGSPTDQAMPGAGGQATGTGGHAAGGQSTGAGGQTTGVGGAPGSAGALSDGGAFASGGSLATGGSEPGPGGSGGVGGNGRGQGGGVGRGGAAAGGSANTSAGAGPVGTCGVAPVTPNATQPTKNLLCYLYSIKGNHVLSGQQEANWNANPNDIAWYTNNGIKFPAILASDFLYRGNASCTSVSASTTRAIAYWNAGGISMFRYHMGMPGAGLTCANDSFSGNAGSAEPTTKPSAAFFTNVVTAGTPENTSLNAKLDYVAVQIGAMKAANVPVIFAVYHETQANGWFWWAETASGPAFVNLWKYTFNYLTATKGLTNIVWLMPFSGSPNAAFYAGKEFADIGGPDQYQKPANLLTFTVTGNNYSASANIFGTTMPIAMHETGSALQPDSMFPGGASPWIMWNVWAGYESGPVGGFSYNTVASLKAAYASQYTITRDAVPNLR